MMVKGKQQQFNTIDTYKTYMEITNYVVYFV